jgi:hypothetical protein
MLAGVDVLVLANVRAPAEDIAPALRARVAAGMGLWITVGERVEARAYNDRLGELLPLLLREPVCSSAPRPAAPRAAPTASPRRTSPTRSSSACRATSACSARAPAASSCSSPTRPAAPRWP